MKIVNCPYCKEELKEAPTRKKKCPNCGNYIFVRKGELLTEEQATIKDWINRLERLDLTEEMFEIHRAALVKQFGKPPLINDVIWRFLNAQLTKSRDFFNLKIVYLEMARLVSMEGKDPKPYLVKACKMELLELKKSGTSKVKVYTCNDNLVCSECRKLENKVFTIAEALETMPVPHLCQNQNGCRCWWNDADF